MEKVHVYSYDEYEKLDESVKTALAKAAAGTLLAAGLNGTASAEEPPYNNADHKADTLGYSYTSKQLDKYSSERAHDSYNAFTKYEREHEHTVPIPRYDKYSKKLGLNSVYTGHYQKKFDDSFFFDMSDNNYTNLGIGFANKALMQANKRCLNGSYDIDDAVLNFKIIRRPGTKCAVALNDQLGVAIDIRDLDSFMSRLSQYYIITPIGDSHGDNSEIFKDKKDNVEWFNISPKPNLRRMPIKNQ